MSPQHTPEPVGDDVAAICATVRALDPAGALAAARAVPPQRRAAVRAALDEVAALFQHHWRFQTAPGSTAPGWPMAPAFSVALAALEASPAEAATLLVRIFHGSDEAAVDAALAVVDGHPRAWRTRLVHSLLHGRSMGWTVVRGLVVAGLVDEPDDPEYAVQLLSGIRWRDLPAARAAEPSVDALLHRLWSLPEVGRKIGYAYPAAEVARLTRPFECAPDRSSYSDEEWSGLLDAWGANDPERRPAVVDGCLAALAGAGGTSLADLRGWVLVHGRIGVTPVEVAERQAAYLDLTAGGVGPAAALGRAQLVELLGAGRLHPDQLLEVTPDVLSRPEKVAVREHLTLLTSMVRSGAMDPRACADVVVPVTGHLPSGVQPLVDKLLALCDAVPVAQAPASSAVAETWGSGRPVGVPASEPVEPVESSDELVDLLVRVLHDPVDPLERERAVDGMLRLRGVRPGVEQQLLRSSRRHGAHDGLQRLVLAWLGHPQKPKRFGTVTRTGMAWDASMVPPGVDATVQQGYPVMRTPQADGTFAEVWTTSWTWKVTEVRWTPADLIGARLQQLERLVVGPPVELIALPTARHGTVDLNALRERLRRRAAAGVTWTERDIATAIVRLDPADRSALRASDILGDVSRRWLDRVEAEESWQWVVAEPSRWLYGPLPVEALRLWQAEPSPSPHDVATDDPVRRWFDTGTVVENWGDHPRHPDGDAELSSCLFHLPSHPDVAAVHAQPEVITWIEQPDADLSGLLRLMADRRVPLGAPSTDLLLWASSYRSARTRAAAAEAIAAAARTGILDARVLGEGILRLVGPGAGPFLTSSFHLEPEPPKLSRIATTLADVARIDEHGERVVLGAVTACLPALRDMRGGVALLETAAAIAERRGVRVDLPEPLASLAAGRSSTRTAQEARRLGGAGRTATLWRPVDPPG